MGSAIDIRAHLTPDRAASRAARIRGRRAATVATLLTLLVCLTPGMAQAAPSVNQVIRPADIGVSDSIPLIGQLASQSVSLPATPGVTWTSVSVQIDWPLEIQSGSLDVTDPNGRLAAITSPPDIGPPQNAVIPLRGKAGQSYQFTISSFLRFRDSSQICGFTVSNVGPTVHVLAIGYQAGPVNDTVGSYLSGPVRQLIVRVNPQGPVGTRQAALQLESILVADDPDPNVSVSLVSNNTLVAEPDRFTRIVTFAGGSAAVGGVSVGTSGMTITGDGPAAQRQVTLLGSRYVPLLQTQQATTIKAPSAVHLTSGTMSLSQLGVSTLSASGVGEFGLPIGFSQAATGSQVSAATFSLHGTNSAPAEGTGATLTLLNGTSPVASTVLQPGTGWTLSGTVPQGALQRDVGLTLQAAYSDRQGGCGTLLPLTFSVDPSSGFTFARGSSAGAGFKALPQMLLPSTDIVLSQPDSFSQLQQAATVLAGVQRLSSLPLQLTLWPHNYLPPKGNPCIVVAAAGTLLGNELAPARLLGGAVQFSSGGQATEVSVGANEAFLTVGHQPNGSSTLSLITPASNPGAGDQLLGALGSKQSEWSSLTGDTAALVPDGQIATAQVATPDPVPLAQVTTSWLNERWVWILFGAGTVIFVMIVGRQLRRWRYRLSERVRRGPGDRRRGPDRRHGSRRGTDR